MRSCASPSPTLPPDAPSGQKAGPGTRLFTTRERERAVAALAAEQHGVVALWQLATFGISPEGARWREGRGRFHRVRRGIYAIGYPAATTEARWMAAVLACGAEAVLSHRSAAALWGLLEDRRSAIDITAPRRRGRVSAGIRIHLSTSLTAADRTDVRGIPCTTVARTLLDIAAVVPKARLRRALAEAEVEQVFDLADTRRLIERSGGCRGVARLRSLLEELDPSTRYTRSELERRFLNLCRKAGLPSPEVNAILDLGDIQLRPDFLWRDARLIVETDGERYHDTYSRRWSDPRREQRLQLAGWRVTRCAWGQVVGEPGELIAMVRGLLGLR